VLETAVAALVLPLCGGALLSLAVEQGLNPAPDLFRRRFRVWVTHFGVWMLAFSLVLAVTARPVFSALLVLAELLFIVLVSNAKRHSLREPFVFADLEYFIDVFRHPRLFLPYFSVWRAVLTVAVFGMVLFLGLTLETSLRVIAGYPAFTGIVAGLLVAASLLLWVTTRGPLPVTFDAEADLRHCGLLACFWYYAIAERRPVAIGLRSPLASARATRTTASLPHIVVIQSESYFDARRLYPQIRPEVYARFDAIRRGSVQHGLLEVPAWGGNTTRSEFAFLSGLGQADIGVHRFNPHRRLARQRLPTIASVLTAAGYQTIGVYPYPVQFNSRDIVYPTMGFDQFIDVAEFASAARVGPYVSDAAVTDRVCTLLRNATQPMLLFVITMENHGPLHLEHPEAGDIERLYLKPPPVGFDDLTVYLRHIENADRMIGALQSVMADNPRDGLLCWYGDHVPILPRVYQSAAFDDGRTDYFVWRKGGSGGASRRLDVAAEDLGAVVLGEAGFSMVGN